MSGWFLLCNCLAKEAVASTVGAKSATLMPRTARAWRSRASDTRKSRFVFTARWMREFSSASLNDVHHDEASAALSVSPPATGELQAAGAWPAGG